MLKTNTLAAALLIAGTLPAAMADKCYALGYWGMNSAGFGPGGTTYAGSEGLVLYNSADEESGRYEKCEHWCSGVCADFIEVPTDKLPAVFQWGATCRGSGFTECHGAYGDQTHIEGLEPESGTDFYGLGIICEIVVPG